MKKRSTTTLPVSVSMLASLLLNRFEPMAPHHIGAIREILDERTDNELRKIITTGKLEGA